MARLARGEYLDPQTTQIVHAVQRCVRRAFLCGNDPFSGKSHEHRRHWIRDRLEFLASVFAIDCLTYAVMSNHLHLVLRSRPDIVRQWSDEEVARRWLRLFPRRRLTDGQPAESTPVERNAILHDPRRLAELRVRLSDVSWWMRCTAENIARMANREDQCTGRFWEGRFRAQLILDEASLLACSMYVDLNPIRAAMATTPEDSRYTGARERIEDLKQQGPENHGPEDQQGADAVGPAHRQKHGRRQSCSGWLSPLEIDERSDPTGPDASDCGRRASHKGFLSMALSRYLELLDWTGQQLRLDQPGSIPSRLAPLLQRLGLEENRWCELVRRFGCLFKRAAGTPSSLSREATRRGQRYLHAPGAAMFSAA